jgi:glycosyltransferase involved in cell wall biosynthesis
MKISIVTVCFNSAATIADTLRSVAVQTHPDIEHLVIDGGSRDTTLDIIRTVGKHVARLVSEPDGGIYDAMNKGLALATGDAVGFLNSDDMLAAPDAIAKLAAALEHPSIDAAYGDLVFVDPRDPAKVRRYWRPGPYRPGACAGGWMPPHPTFYIRRSVLQRARGFRTDYRLQADFELILRLFEIDRIRWNYLPSTLVRMRVGGATTGSFRNIIRGNLEAARACRENGFPGGLAFMLRKMGRRLPQFLARPSADS